MKDVSGGRIVLKFSQIKLWFVGAVLHKKGIHSLVVIRGTKKLRNYSKSERSTLIFNNECRSNVSLCEYIRTLSKHKTLRIFCTFSNVEMYWTWRRLQTNVTINVVNLVGWSQYNSQHQHFSVTDVLVFIRPSSGQQLMHL